MPRRINVRRVSERSTCPPPSPTLPALETRNPEPESLPPRWRWAVRWGAPALTLAILALMAWNCAFNPKIRFLTPGPGKWIVFPTPPELSAYPGFELTAVFRRAFALNEKPAVATISWRCLNSSELLVNGTPVPTSAAAANWKKVSEADIAPLLREGRNEISVLATNDLGPPSLSLELKLPDRTIPSDETWMVSIVDSDWHKARAASFTPGPENGNQLTPLETTAGGLARRWPWLCLFAAIAGGAVLLMQNSLARRASLPWVILAGLAVAWALLFIHNFPSVPVAAGFDAASHLDYVNYISIHHSLPAARESWETFQPPLYYAVSAALLGLAHCQALSALGTMLLRYLSLGIGAINLALIFAGLRTLFPGDWKKPVAGLVLGAFLPPQIYLLHYTTNETLGAMFVTAALCAGLRILQARKPWPGWDGVVGIALGLALLSKASALLAVPVLFGAIALKLLLRKERSPGVWLGTLGGPMLICVLICGWHYLKLWREYGDPFIGNWDPRLGDPWWQFKGYQTPAYYFSFGWSLARPFFSGLYSFWDGVYSTLWGDALWGGRTDFWGRIPWNYDFMAVGFLLALVPTALVLTGIVRGLKICFRDGNAAWLLLIGTGWIFALAILGMSFKVPSYAQTKAFYGLPALLPFCAAGALGFEYWAGRGRASRFIVATLFSVWLINVYASFWIQPRDVRTELTCALSASVFAKADVTEAYEAILKEHPNDSETAVWVASNEAKKNPLEAVQILEQTLKRDPDNVQVESELAWDLCLCHKYDDGLAHAKRAVALAPDDVVSAQMWRALAMYLGNYPEAITASRYVLALNPTDLQTQFDLGMALMKTGQGGEAIRHFTAVLKVKPEWAEAHFCRGLCLLDNAQTKTEALAEMKEAVRLDPANKVWAEDLKRVQSLK